jgi:Cysteine-rich CWC
MNRGKLLASRDPHPPPRQDVGMPATPSACPRSSKQFDCAIGTGACRCAGVEVEETMRAALAQYYDGCLCRDCLQAIGDERPQVPTVRAFLASQLRRKRRRQA